MPRTPTAPCPRKWDWCPAAGAIVGFLQIATDVQPIVLGKPSPGIFHYALRTLGTDLEATATIGDRSETDIVGGQRAGVCTIAVLSGAGTAEDFAAMQPPPDWIFPSLAELNRAYFG